MTTKTITKTKTAVIVVQLDPFYQNFLRSFYHCKKPFMEFPEGDDLEYCISSLIKEVPAEMLAEIEESEPGESDFKVEIKLRSWQFNADNWYLNRHGLKFFASRVAEMFQFQFHEEVKKKVNSKKMRWLQKDAIEHFMIMYNIPITTTNYERLAKEFQRWKNRGYVKKHRKKIIRKNSRLSGM
ncbi:hypothetical protein [uncultured Draconibacterium sp.]|uniref:hypothetical protein n=1 Tax=uncultured Draconibacterium sp. TaxID=1573823 RepID=UPI0025F41E59|nr:hypothetical protein [uncultured Draconibacterium sp.]